jgi:hypothetical protein
MAGGTPANPATLEIRQSPGGYRRIWRSFSLKSGGTLS